MEYGLCSSRTLVWTQKVSFNTKNTRDPSVIVSNITSSKSFDVMH